MGPLLYVIGIMSCTDDGALCREVRVAPVSYATREACIAQVGRVLTDNSDVDAPVVSAQCRRASPEMASATTGNRG